MADFYADMAGIASGILAEFKQGTVVLIKSTPGTPDPATPWVPGTPSSTQYALNATVVSVADEFIDGTTILATDDMVTAAPFGVEPGPGDTMTIDGKAVTIIRQMRSPKAGTVVTWKWVVRS
jgi:hypothetical protein